MRRRLRPRPPHAAPRRGAPEDKGLRHLGEEHPPAGLHAGVLPHRPLQTAGG